MAETARMTETRATPLMSRLAAAPISWGVCEVPGWGEEMAPDRVLAEMSELGFTAAELGPTGYLGHDASEVRDRLGAHGLRLVGGFVPLVLHEPDQDDATLDMAANTAQNLAAAGADVFVTAAVTDWDWGPRSGLDASAWDHTFTMLDRVGKVVAAAGLHHVLHPHVGTIVEQSDEVQRVVDGSAVDFCLDTGHLIIGGVDPVDFASAIGDRVGHVHLKDVDLAIARRVIAGELSLVEGTQHGMFRALGDGEVAVGEVISRLESAGYCGWYVLEQDVALTDGIPPPGQGPRHDVAKCLRFLRQMGDAA